MTPSDDLPERIVRLERLLDGLESARGGGTAEGGASNTAGLSPIDRLRDVAGLLQQRATHPGCDEGDAVAMRALLQALTSITITLRALATDIDGALSHVAEAIDDSHQRLNALEETR